MPCSPESVPPAGANRGRYANPAFDRLIESALRAFDARDIGFGVGDIVDAVLIDQQKHRVKSAKVAQATPSV